MALLSTKRSSNENYPNFESRFTAAVSKLNSHAANTLPESLTAFMPMANSSIDSNQRISILVAATAQSSELISSTASEELLKSVKYDLFVSILKQCDKAKPEHGSDAIRVNNANFRKRFFKGRKYTPKELAKFKARSRCRVSTKWGHWYSDPNPDGSLKPGVYSSKIPPDEFKAHTSQQNALKKCWSLISNLHTLNRY